VHQPQAAAAADDATRVDEEEDRLPATLPLFDIVEVSVVDSSNTEGIVDDGATGVEAEANG
jgi:hypothetical protein